ncbi:hypothetical protein GYMLUDRAFT_574566 [Collybiopsis luxurians FD-317 M1]|uniref:CCZ1/INTU/HSP4 first Longin domain-containing protein n=1 Tax=Collybiopsis luxurians FD-317 M1 TaxID=944289 RepID=A0A0D0C0K8_9AGAR|nr:hypothetical protein GYMLUDRAFT_574566 [Collybiopsis luxurians FD-317 M1]
MVRQEISRNHRSSDAIMDVGVQVSHVTDEALLFDLMESTRIPANLSYLTIYNSTLRPVVPTPDDEDAEEQAQILFYTSKERAISRDRMLRQVGLAKALVNFSEMFNLEDGCENVHSQTRRMIMVFPEPDFCIHAGVELAKSPRASSKPKEKGVKSILKSKEKETQPVAYDYSEASVNDQALRADLLRGYEQFKLSHGSFTSILTILGQEALELQLERFFTVWAWSWNLEDGFEFGQHLGTPLHPMHRSILPLLDTLSNDIPEDIIPIAVTSTHAIPSTRFLEAQFSPALSPFLLKLVPSPSESIPPFPSTPSPPPDGTVRPKRPPDPASLTERARSSADDTSQSTFMGMNVDIGKWGWLSFGKNGKKADTANAKGLTKTEEGVTASADSAQTTRLPTAEEPSLQVTETSIDQNALDDAMSSENIPASGSPPQVKPEPQKEYYTTAELDNVSIVSGINIQSDSVSTPSSPPREFMTAIVHLAEEATPLNTRRRKIYYLTRYPFLFALVGLDRTVQNFDPPISELEMFSKKANSVLDAIVNVVEDEALKSSTETIPSLTKILQPKDRHVFALERAPFAIHGDSENFTSRSIHLFNARALLRSRHGVQEVFSRGQSPQHWHMGRSVEGELSGDMYMQVFRKETSLTDVDNVLSGVVRRTEEELVVP